MKFNAHRFALCLSRLASTRSSRSSGRRRGRNSGRRRKRRRCGMRCRRRCDRRCRRRCGGRRSCWRLTRCSRLILAHAPLVFEVVILAVHIRALRARAQRAARSVGLSHDGGNFLPAPASAGRRQERFEVCNGAHLERRVFSALRQPFLLGARVRTLSRRFMLSALAHAREPPLQCAPTATHLNCAGAVAASVFTHLRVSGEQPAGAGHVTSRLSHCATTRGARTSSPSGARVQRTP